MAHVLVATADGCLTLADDGVRAVELHGRQVGPLAPAPDGTCLAVVDGQAVWRRSATGTWSPVAAVERPVQAIAPLRHGVVLLGGMEEAIVLRLSAAGAVERLESFDRVPGREEWFANGPPLGVRALTAALDGTVLLAAVHVGGLPRSSDGGASWQPTLPVLHDVHDVHAGPGGSHVVAAAAAVGLYASLDGGAQWTLFSDGLEGMTSLAVAVLREEVLFSVQDGPFATRSQLWRWRIGDAHIGPVRDGLPSWLDGKVDTGGIAAGQGRAAVVDGGGNVWCSRTGAVGWRCLAEDVPCALGVAIV